MATSDDAHIPAYDNTKLQALNVCPTWGIVSYSLNKRMGEPGGRNMPLEMGSTAHELFAAVRIWQLREYEGYEGLSDYHGSRLFGSDRYRTALDSVQLSSDARAKSMNFCLSILETFGYYDDPRDKRRTYSNLEEACIQYIDKWKWDRHKIWVRDPADPQSDVGIEIPFDVVLTYTLEDDTVFVFRYIGKADGLHVNKEGNLVLHENKTASRIDEPWRDSFMMATQITGYMIALSVFAQSPIEFAELYGMAVPLPRTMEWNGVIREPLTRKPHHYNKWFHWFITTVLLDQQFRDDPTNAPIHTHSCNRYFRSCPLIPFCDSDEEEKLQMLREMREEVWSPLHEVNQGGD